MVAVFRAVKKKHDRPVSDSDVLGDFIGNYELPEEEQ